MSEYLFYVAVTVAGLLLVLGWTHLLSISAGSSCEIFAPQRIGKLADEMTPRPPDPIVVHCSNCHRPLKFNALANGGGILVEDCVRCENPQPPVVLCPFCREPLQSRTLVNGGGVLVDYCVKCGNPEPRTNLNKSLT